MTDPSDKLCKHWPYPANVLLLYFLHISIIHIAQFIFMFCWHFDAPYAACQKPHQASDLFWLTLLAARTKRARAFTYKTSLMDLRPQGASSDQHENTKKADARPRRCQLLQLPVRASNRRSLTPADHSIRRGIWLNEPDPECADRRSDLVQSEPRLRGCR